MPTIKSSPTTYHKLCFGVVAADGKMARTVAKSYSSALKRAEERSKAHPSQGPYRVVVLKLSPATPDDFVGA